MILPAIFRSVYIVYYQGKYQQEFNSSAAAQCYIKDMHNTMSDKLADYTVKEYRGQLLLQEGK